MIAGLVPTFGVEDFVFVLVSGSTPVLTDFGVKVLLDRIRSLRVSRALDSLFQLCFTLYFCTCFVLALEVRRFNVI